VRFVQTAVPALPAVPAPAKPMPNGTPETPPEARRRVSRRGPINLIAMLTPAVLFPLGLILLRDAARFAWLRGPVAGYPSELWIIALFGGFATAGGTLDYLFHRSGATAVGAKEHHSHLAALSCGVVVFALMAGASVSARPQALLLPVFATVIMTVVLICYDEFVFHRKRCDAFETFTHRMLVFGNGIAWLAWAHWCFVRGGAGA